PGGVRSADGEEHPCDAIVWATGFDNTPLPAPMTATAAGGRPLAEAWAEGAHAYLGMTVPGFPNMFVIYGPNTNTGNTSVLYFEEAQGRYVVQAVAALARGRARA